MIYLALTAYGVTIPRVLTDKESAADWIENEGLKLYPGSRVVRMTATGAKRTIWRHPEVTVNPKANRRCA